MLSSQDLNFCYAVDLSRLKDEKLKLVPFDVRILTDPVEKAP